MWLNECLIIVAVIGVEGVFSHSCQISALKVGWFKNINKKPGQRHVTYFN